MPYRIETYKSVLDKYLHSGIRFLRYTCQPVGKAKVYFPYISVAQINSFIKDHLFMSGMQAHYKNSMPYSTWKWFTTNYDIQGMDKIDRSKDERYLVMVLDGKAAIIQITSQGFPMAELSHRVVYSLQHKLFNKATERLCKYGYYRCIFENGQFVYHDKGLSFELMVKVSQDVNYIGDNLFVDFVKGLYIDDVYPNLKHVHNRYIKRNKGTTSEQNREEWIAHTKSLFERLSFSTQQEEAVKAEVIAYCDGVKKQASTIPEQSSPSRNNRNHFKRINLRPSVIKELCRLLKADAALPMSTKEEDFIYYFSGRGEIPTEKLQWKKDITTLALLIFILCNDKPEWAVASNVFEGIDKDSINNIHSRLKNKDKTEYEKRKNEVRKYYIEPAESDKSYYRLT